MLAYTKYLKEKEMGKLTMKELKWGGGLVRINDDLEDYFSEAMLQEILLLFNDGYEPEEIAEFYDFLDPDEVFLALFHLARKELTNRPFAYRKRSEKRRNLDVIRALFPDAKGIGPDNHGKEQDSS